MTTLPLALSILVLAASPAAAKAAPKAAAKTASAKAPSKGGQSGKKSANLSLKAVNITSDRFEVMPNADKAVWSGSVVAVRDDITIQCDLLTAEFGEHHKIRTIVCEGHVHMEQKSEADPKSGKKAVNREAWGEKAVFDNMTSLVTITGDPSAKEGNNTIRGEKVLVYVAEERIVVEKPKMVFDTDEATGGAL